MVNTAFLTSEVTVGGFTVRIFLQEQKDGTQAFRSTYTRNGRRVAYHKNKAEVDACNKARWELTNYLESIGWKRSIEFSSGIGNITGDVIERWIAPENPIEYEGEPFDAFMLRTVYEPAWARDEYPGLGGW